MTCMICKRESLYVCILMIKQYSFTHLFNKTLWFSWKKWFVDWSKRSQVGQRHVICRSGTRHFRSWVALCLYSIWILRGVQKICSFSLCRHRHGILLSGKAVDQNILQNSQGIGFYVKCICFIYNSYKQLDTSVVDVFHEFPRDSAFRQTKAASIFHEISPRRKILLRLVSNGVCSNASKDGFLVIVNNKISPIRLKQRCNMNLWER